MKRSNLTEIRESIVEAERSIKDCEIITGQLPQGAVNEIRYAAVHLVHYIESEDQESLDKYHRHCKRAKYDASELSVLILKSEIDNYIKSHPFIHNEDIVSEKMGDKKYEGILTLRRKINEELLAANANKENRQDYLDKIQKAVPELKKCKEMIELHISPIMAAIRRHKRMELLTILGVIIGVLGIVVTFIS